MIRYGDVVEGQTTVIEKGERTVETIERIKDFIPKEPRYRRVTTRIRVCSKREEMAEYLIFSQEIEHAHADGRLVRGDRDPSLRPVFVVEMPPANKNIDGSYFVIRSYTELML